MIGAETIVEQVFTNLLSLLPFKILKSYERGVRWRLGKNPHEIGPGPHWTVPLYHAVLIYDVVDEVMDLPTQSVITKDNKLVCFSVNIAFTIVDVVAHACGVQDFFESTAGAAMTHLARRVRELTLEELEQPEGLEKLEKSLKGTLTTKMKKWGTEVIDVGFTNFTPVTRNMRIFLDAHRSAHSLT